MERSRLFRATLKECDVEDCVVDRTEFKGMKLRNGVWKSGKLIGCVEGKDEVVAVSLVGLPPLPCFIGSLGLGPGMFNEANLYRPTAQVPRR